MFCFLSTITSVDLEKMPWKFHIHLYQVEIYDLRGLI